MAPTDWEGTEETHADPEEQRVLFAALDSFYQYTKVAHFNTTHLRRQNFYALPRDHWELLVAHPFSYLETLDAVDDALDKNGELASAILDSGLQSFGLHSQSSAVAEGNGKPEWRGKATSNDLEKARSTLRQFYRDWSEEGASEREASFGPLIEALEQEQSLQPDAKMRVLVPGAGLGRLVFDLCCAGFHTEGNEISYHQLIASAYVLNVCPRAHAHTLFPWVHSFSNHKSRADHLASVQVPDVHPGETLSGFQNPGEMSMSASDFLLLYGDEDQKDRFDAVATLFFLDTAPNVIRYIEVIKNCLRPGGIIVNMGPLLWHFENNAPATSSQQEKTQENERQGIADPGSFELSDDEVVALFEKFGFSIERKESDISAPYIQDPTSMLQNTYKASFWIARKQ